MALLRSGFDVRVEALTLLLLACQPRATTYSVDVPPPNGSAQMILPMASALPEQKAEPVQAGFRVGDAVEVEWQGDWWPAHVTNMSSTFPITYAIHYDGYGDEWDEWVGLDRIRALAR